MAARTLSDQEVDVQDYEDDAETLQKVVKQANNLLDDGQLQSARRILAELASELRVTTINIPLGTFPTAIKGAIALIDQQKNDEAGKLLDEVLDTLVEETESTPLPVLRTEAFLARLPKLGIKRI